MWKLIEFIAPGVLLVAWVHYMRAIYRWTFDPQESSWQRELPLSWRRWQRYW